jgi:flagellar basal-body rod modification protein FlgD
MSTVSSVTDTSSTTTTSTSSNTTLGQEDFLELLTTQLKYQDPLDPMDSSEYASQLAEFSQLEQLTNLNDYMSESIDANYLLTQSINNTLVATLVGNDVKVSAETINYTTQDSVDFSYTLPSSASDVTIKIYNSSGTLVKTITPDSLTKGESKLSWDFTDNNGGELPEGTYTTTIEATDAVTGNDLEVSLYRIGTIDAVKFTDDGTVLTVDGMEYSLSDVLEILGVNNE